MSDESFGQPSTNERLARASEYTAYTEHRIRIHHPQSSTHLAPPNIVRFEGVQ